jgi:hypothetical protein
MMGMRRQVIENTMSEGQYTSYLTAIIYTAFIFLSGYNIYSLAGWSLTQ